MTTWAFVPTVVTATCYVVTHRLLHQHTNIRFAEYRERHHLHSNASAHVDQSLQRAVQRMKCLSHRIIVMIILKFSVHYPIAFFYLLRTEDDLKPLTNLIVLSLHFSSTLFNAVLYGLADPQLRRQHQKLAERLCRSCCG
ncbi:hypothetical protein RvY_06289 [Ramazzottius varieornatus]|uniref:Uncharacterized protein n=1 Tax=Ramazzottius varieornatus TaxID=947166 RepID=A0A1D1V6R9_RAMVA|nr:hypothetical protein RvY_06289 [Ramazzottius varieornatus]